MSGDLDPVIHPTHRLKICAILAAGTTIEMGILKEQLDLSPSALSKQVSALADAGYVAAERSRTDSRRVWLTLTKEGKRAYRSHVKALRAIVSDADF